MTVKTNTLHYIIQEYTNKSFHPGTNTTEYYVTKALEADFFKIYSQKTNQSFFYNATSSKYQ